MTKHLEIKCQNLYISYINIHLEKWIFVTMLCCCLKHAANIAMLCQELKLTVNVAMLCRGLSNFPSFSQDGNAICIFLQKVWTDIGPSPSSIYKKKTEMVS